MLHSESNAITDRQHSLEFARLPVLLAAGHLQKRLGRRHVEPVGRHEHNFVRVQDQLLTLPWTTVLETRNAEWRDDDRTQDAAVAADQLPLQKRL